MEQNNNEPGQNHVVKTKIWYYGGKDEILNGKNEILNEKNEILNGKNEILNRKIEFFNERREFLETKFDNYVIGFSVLLFVIGGAFVISQFLVYHFMKSELS
ncbi:9577_t:CDS:2 [Funneliformis mosseae]|uniref:9577_t:CDS:1 n=1 Tax=Funneliformis mosseae TaxID=27381 RepID=A0A9N8WBH6_FUNMO|nr:9577_t:CDS:2 [Funneliformis mosseae]